jgi:hypothetical protein
MSCEKCTGAVPVAGLSRRAVLNRFGMGVGGAKRVIYLFMAGGPSQLETFDYKPLLRAQRRAAARLGAAGAAAHRACRATSRRCRWRIAVRVQAARRNGTWVSDLLPHTARIVDDLCIVKSMHTEAINHDPAITFFQTGSQHRRPARAWARGSLRPRQRQREPAGVRRAALAGREAPTSRSTRGCGAAASCPRSTRACSSAAARTRCCI